MRETTIVRTAKEIEDQMSKILEAIGAGRTNYSGMTFEEGAEAMYRWLVGESDDPPIEEE